MFPERPRHERDAAIEEAIVFFESALKVRTRDGFPHQWALTTCMLAHAYESRMSGDRGRKSRKIIQDVQSGSRD